MDKQRHEMLLRETAFSRRMLASAWKEFSDSDRIDFLLHLYTNRRDVSEEILGLSLLSKCEAVRILAAKLARSNYSPANEVAIANDESEIVRLGNRLGAGLTFQADNEYYGARWRGMTQPQLLADIALSNSIDAKAFCAFICHTLADGSLSETGATECVIEYVRNPELVAAFTHDIVDAEVWEATHSEFEAVWALCATTPESVHQVVALEFPVTMGGEHYQRDISISVIDRFSQFATETLAWRQCPRLLHDIAVKPDKYSERVKWSAEAGAKYHRA